MAYGVRGHQVILNIESDVEHEKKQGECHEIQGQGGACPQPGSAGCGASQAGHRRSRRTCCIAGGRWVVPGAVLAFITVPSRAGGHNADGRGQAEKACGEKGRAKGTSRQFAGLSGYRLHRHDGQWRSAVPPWSVGQLRRSQYRGDGRYGL